MGKGFKLKELLSNQKTQQKIDKEETTKKTKQQQKLADEGPKVISSTDLEAAETKKAIEAAEKAKALAEAAAASKKDAEEYKSNALSKKEKRQLKKQVKKETVEVNESEEEEEEEEEEELDLNKLAYSASEGESEDDNESEEEKEEVEVEELKEDEDIPLSDVEFDSDADIVPHHKLTINNTKAMGHALERIQLPWAKHSFQEHQTLTSAENTDANIKDIYDDTERELAFYKQSLDAVTDARDELKRLKIPFLRPLDYFAEMVKSDEHMDKIKHVLVREASEKKAREDSRRQRDLKKFGKQVQHATIEKRQLEKKDTLDKIKDLKKKRKHNEISNEDFDVGVEDAAETNSRSKPNGKRNAKNAKYGQGGMKRFNRKNDANSAADITGFSQKKMKGKSARPGKSRRTKRF